MQFNDHSSGLLLEENPVRETWSADDAFDSTTESAPVLSPAPAWLDRGQIPGLDGLRAVAVLLVLICHSAKTAGFPPGDLLHRATDQGRIGVDVFFIISGFLITTLLAREWDRHGRVNLKRFYVRRFLRIMPVYFAMLITVAICQQFGVCQIDAPNWIAALTYTTNFLSKTTWELGHTWSLSIEEHFYLLWPFVLFAGGLAGGWRVAIGCIFGCWLARCGIAVILPHLVSRADASYYASMAETWTFTRLDTISMGCLLALACRSATWRTRLDRLTPPTSLWAYFTIICVSVMVNYSTKYHLCVAYTLHAVCITLLMWGLIRSEGLAQRVLSHRWLTTIGLGSYSIYLWQQLLVHPKQSGWVYCFPQNVLLTLAIAITSYWVIERPMNNLKGRLAA